MRTTRGFPLTQPRRFALVASVFWFTASAAAFAQTSAGSASILASMLRPGMTVWITDTIGREEKARIVAVSPDAVSTETGEVRTADIVRVRARYADSLLNGAAIGAGTFIGTGLFMCQLMEPWDVCNDPGPIVQMGALGAGIGIGVDALVRGRRTIFDARPGAAHLRLAPFIGHRGRGVQVVLGF